MTHEKQHHLVDARVSMKNLHLCSSLEDDELSQLEKKIKQAYVSKALCAQLAEKRALEASHSRQEQLTAVLAATTRDSHANFYEEKHCKRLQAIELRANQARQIEEKKEAGLKAKEEERCERQILIELDQATEQCERIKKLLLKEELSEQQMLESLTQFELRELKQLHMKEQNHKKAKENLEYELCMVDRDKKIKKLQLIALKKREEVINKVVESFLMEKINKQTDEMRQQLLADVLREEIRLSLELETQKNEKRQKQEASNVALTQMKQFNLEIESRKRFLEREYQFAEAVMMQIMASEQIERLNKVAQNRRRIEYRTELKGLMSDRAKAYDEELKKIRCEMTEQLDREKLKHKKTREAGLKLLEQHMDNVSDFLGDDTLFYKADGASNEGTFVQASSSCQRTF